MLVSKKHHRPNVGNHRHNGNHSRPKSCCLLRFYSRRVPNAKAIPGVICALIFWCMSQVQNIYRAIDTAQLPKTATYYYLCIFKLFQFSFLYLLNVISLQLEEHMSYVCNISIIQKKSVSFERLCLIGKASIK